MYGLIGYPLSHSFSAEFFNKKFKEEKIAEKYCLFPLKTIEEFPKLTKTYPDLKGLNVTIPYKEKIIPYLDTLSEEAHEINAVNVINFEKSGKLKGFNTDIIGFRDSLIPLLQDNMSSALILGTGGASKAVAYVLKKLEIDFSFVSRNKDKGHLSYNELDKETILNNPIIINTTPLGMWPEIDKCPDIPYEYINPGHLCYDLIYNPEETLFLKKCAKMGAHIKNGLEMLHLQALAAWNIWET